MVRASKVRGVRYPSKRSAVSSGVSNTRRCQSPHSGAETSADKTRFDMEIRLMWDERDSVQKIVETFVNVN